MPRYKLTIEYVGTSFVGWQRQDNGYSVQQALEEAVAGFCQSHVTLHAAGRTDAGVHALGQVAHVTLPRDYPPDRVRDALNAHLRPRPVAVIGVETVCETFHARFSAVERRYLYRIVNRRAPVALEQDRAWWVPSRLDVPAMSQAALVLIGRHDFSTFRASECQANSPIRTLDELFVERQGEEIRITARARSFLHHQVRNMVGTLRRVGEGKWTSEDVRHALDARDRRAGGQTAPACGLYLTGVRY
ncbi:MAG: tRNA pseudouridine(38-40) synthase TruA [Alphaproteobacteria bacterium]|nr:tRNA pseudouridine(38-40) synthase TruA [Alphaproteobacteria bacterium]